MRLRSRRLIAVGLAGLLAMLVGAGCGGDDETTTSASESGGATQQDISVALDWQPGSQHMGLYYAYDKGYYEEDGLNVKFEIPSDAAAPLRFVGAERVDLGISYEPEVLIGAAEGLPVTAVASIVPVPLASFVSMPESGVTGPDQLAGKKVGYSGIPKEEGMINSILEDQGLSPDDVDLINVGFNLVPAALNGKIDAMVGAFRNGTAVELAERSGEEPVVIPVDEIGVPTYDELVLVANSERLENDPDYADAVDRFIAASVKGTEAAVDDHEGAFNALKTAINGAIPDKQLQAELDATWDLMLPPGDRSTGCFDLDAWREFSTWVQDNELTDGEVPPGDEVATNDHAPDC